MTEQKKEGECCSTSGSEGSCCCCGGGKKFFIGLIAGLILTAAAFGFYSAGQCAAGKGKMCPIMSGSQMQPMQQMQK